MPGRQAHGRLLLAASGPKGKGGNNNNKSKSNNKNFKKSRAKSTSKALDAFAIAAEQVGTERMPKGVRMRDLEEHPSERGDKKRPRNNDEDEDDFDNDDEEDDEPPQPQQKRARKNEDFEGFSDHDDGASDSEEWHVGVGEGDEDSELDSDEAFGESDEEKFEGFAFGGTKGIKKPKKKRADSDDDEEEEEEEDEDDLESLGSDAIDLATALDQYSESEEEGGEEGSDSEEEDEESTDGDDESEEEDEEDPDKLDSLQKMIAGFGGDSDEEMEDAPSGKTKLSLSDLGLAGVKDPHIKKSLKLMNKEEKISKPGAAKKLAVPLAKRAQDRNLRAAAYDQTNKTLDRWIDTVKHNRRADHLVFPLAQNAHDAGLDTGELRPVTQKSAGTELENAILTIMEESGLGPSATKAEMEAGEAGPKLSQAEIQEIARQKRKERELHSREAARAKRIKKIKSKAYRRIHRKELLKDQEAEHQALLEAGVIDSDEEREAFDRQRAEERMGTRHRESKWAKLGKKAGRAVWDDDFRAGLTEMNRRKEELRRRVEGRKAGSDDDDSDGSYESGDERADRSQLLAELEDAAAYGEDGEPKKGLMAMKFMQRGEERRKQENDELVAQIRRELDSEDDGESADETEIGRRTFGAKESTLKLPGDIAKEKKERKKQAQKAADPVVFRETIRTETATSRTQTVTDDSEPVESAPGAAGAWSRVPQEGRKSKKASKTKVEELDLSNVAMLAATKSSKPKPKTQTAEANGDGASDEDEIHLPMAIRDQELIKRAFAGEDVVGEFEREKHEMEVDDDDKEIDNTLPGWGGWVGEGVSKREQARHKGRFVTKVEGIKKKDRKDYKLKDVIITEKRVKKNDAYLATQMPHPFESHQQYERSLRLPVGPEWMTKESFQESTKPRVIIKQGIIAPMSKPMR
ncbi:Utp14 protein-domain-containing protein [Podospora fimiseda]|uniref:Utp14 protein-domain-containing protein n=1 Tax=Podospora fimiseda TaxID=252190 RepID=A0AAN7H694_9PEZI|nr:Utp14 protein-domain-containing protein [Podospora fimiseda]